MFDTSLDTLILASKKFYTLKFMRYIADFIYATLVSLHYNLYKKEWNYLFFKSATSTSENGASQYFLFVGSFRKSWRSYTLLLALYAEFSNIDDATITQQDTIYLTNRLIAK